jgi:sensor histidine kinase YesM
MNTKQRFPGIFVGNATYLFVAGLLAIPVFLILQMFVSSMRIPEDEAVTFVFTVLVVAGAFIGRYLAAMWAFRLEKIPTRLFIALGLLSTGLIIWMFFYAAFPLRDRPFISLLLFGLPLFAVSIIFGSIVKLTRTITKRQIAEARMSAAHSASELQLLQSQISPHFLFNTLNNMYGLSITQHEKIPQLLLKLSDLLRYSVYDASKKFVPVADELSYIVNYIEFEKMRIGDRLGLTVDFEDFSASDAKIAPMLLVNFVENAFKHSKNTTSESIFIHISLKTWENQLLFSIVNSYNPNERKADKDHSGLGMENVKKRLGLLYPSDHHLVIEDADNTYKVMLQLKMK